MTVTSIGTGIWGVITAIRAHRKAKDNTERVDEIETKINGSLDEPSNGKHSTEVTHDLQND